jgi:thymidylate synthase
MDSFHTSIKTAFEHAYITAISSLMKFGRTARPRGFETKELIAFTLGFENSRKRLIFNPERKVNLGFMLAECLWIITGQEDVEMVSFYNSKIAQFSDDGKIFHGAYGPRLRKLHTCFDQEHKINDQIQMIINKLKEDPDSRQAVCNIFYAGRDYVKTKDVPCTLTFQFFVREYAGEKQLEMIANMRSNDVILGLSTDAFNFTVFQEIIASELNIEPGWYYHVDGSLHIYERDYEWAERILKNGDRKVNEILEMPKMPANSLQYVTKLIDLERKLRKENIIEVNELPEYWQKWLLTFACYKCLKENNLDEAEKYNNLIGDHPFSIFMQRSIERKKLKIKGEHE